MLELILFILLGVFLGIITGLIPGIHPNMIILSIPFIISLGIEPTNVIIFIAAMGVSNSLADFLPSIFLGAPDGDTSLSVLPGHKMLLKGQGYDAVKLTVIGGIGSAILLLPIIPVLFYTIPTVVALIQPYTHILIGIVGLYMILTEKNKVRGAFIFLFSGLVGVLTLQLPINSTLTLFPLMAGFFGLSSLFLQKKGEIPEQTFPAVYSNTPIKKGIISGVIGGIASGFLPGVGSNQIAALASTDKNEHTFLVTMGAITTANIIVSMLALWLINKSRSGVAVAIGEITSIGFNEFLVIVVASVIAAVISGYFTLKIAKSFSNVDINYDSLRTGVITFIVILTTLFIGLPGLIILLTSAALGIFTILSGVKRGNMMGSLMVPVILFYMSI
jgi:putative membrane protein